MEFTFRDLEDKLFEKECQKLIRHTQHPIEQKSNGINTIQFLMGKLEKMKQAYKTELELGGQLENKKRHIIH